MDHPQPVYFIGIALPDSLNRQIAELKTELHASNDHFLKPLLPHVTLLHPPALRGVMPEDIIPKVHEAAERYLPFTITLDEIGFFGKNVCYIKAESHSLYSLQARLVRLLPPEAQATHYKRPYLPHVTIAQVYEPHMLDTRQIEEIINKKIKLPITFQVDSVTYFKRILPREYELATIR